MKNQYFGDNRDLFKYDLVMKIMRASLVDHFTFIPMLTEPDKTSQGENRDRKEAKAGTENEELVSFLNEFKEKSKRDIKHLKSFFAKRAIETEIYYGKDKYFSNQERYEYFKQIDDDKLLSSSLVFVDPDKGLEIDKSRKEDILYSEVKDLYKRMDNGSLLMVFQFFPREKRETYLRRISEKLKEEVGNLPVYISDNQIVFFFLAKDENVRESLARVIQDYKKTYPKLA